MAQNPVGRLLLDDLLNLVAALQSKADTARTQFKKHGIQNWEKDAEIAEDFLVKFHKDIIDASSLEVFKKSAEKAVNIQ